MKHLLIFGGTTEGRELAQQLSANQRPVVLCVATEYGKEMIPQPEPNLVVKVGRLVPKDMCQMMTDYHVDTVIDATHPYAVAVSEHIALACEEQGTTYLRLLREQSGYDGNSMIAQTIPHGCTMVANGNVLATTGSKQVAEYMALPDYKNRLYTRVLPTPESIALCKKAGLEEDHIITSFGVLSVEENLEMISKYKIKTMITKDGGQKGGFDQKRMACEQAGIAFIVVKRPTKEDGFSMEDILHKIGG